MTPIKFYVKTSSFQLEVDPREWNKKVQHDNVPNYRNFLTGRKAPTIGNRLP